MVACNVTPTLSIVAILIQDDSVVTKDLAVETFSVDGTSPPPTELVHLNGQRFETEALFLAAARHCPDMRIKSSRPICQKRAATRFYCPDPVVGVGGTSSRCTYGALCF